MQKIYEIGKKPDWLSGESASARDISSNQQSKVHIRISEETCHSKTVQATAYVYI